MGIVIAWGNQKGGVAKTTSCACTSFLLSQQGYKVLVVDFDAQGNQVPLLTGQPKDEYEDYNILLAIEEQEPEAHIVQISDTLHLLPSDRYLANFPKWVETEYEDVFDRSQVLKEFISPLTDRYDFVMIDCPPALDLLTINAVAASNYVIALLHPSSLAFDALNEFMDTIESLKGNEVAPDIDILGILLTMVERNQMVDNQFSNLAKDVYGDLVFNTKVHRRTRFKQYASIGIKTETAMDNSILRPYRLLIKEMLKRAEA